MHPKIKQPHTDNRLGCGCRIPTAGARINGNKRYCYLMSSTLLGGPVIPPSPSGRAGRGIEFDGITLGAGGLESIVINIVDFPQNRTPVIDFFLLTS